MRLVPSRSRIALLSALGSLALAGSAPSFAAVPGTVSGHHRAGNDPRLYARVRDGVYTVDGMVAKIELNYDVDGTNFLYLFVPGIGTAVVSPTPAADALTSAASLTEGELTFTLDGHHFGLTGVRLLGGNGDVPPHLYVHLDRSAWHLGRMPMVGFGNRAALPYEWPGALAPEHVDGGSEESSFVPTIPSTLLPSFAGPAPAAPVSTSPGPTALHPSALKPVALKPAAQPAALKPIALKPVARR